MNSALTIGTNTIFLECIFIFFYLFIFYFFSVSIWFSTSSCGSTKQTKYCGFILYRRTRVHQMLLLHMMKFMCKSTHPLLSYSWKIHFQLFSSFFSLLLYFLRYPYPFERNDGKRHGESTQHTHHTYIEYKKSTQKKRKSKHKM